MKKLRLDLDNLQVESFDTSARADGMGTVHGHFTLNMPRCDIDPAPGPPLHKTIGPGCTPPGPTDQPTCGLDSCAYGNYCVSFESCVVSCPGGGTCHGICLESRVVCQAPTIVDCTTKPD